MKPWTGIGLGAGVACALIGVPSAGPVSGQTGAAVSGSGWHEEAPPLTGLVAFSRSQSDLRVVIERYAEDRAALTRRYDVAYSPVLRGRLRDLGRGWLGQLAQLDFGSLNREGQVDYILLRNQVEFEMAMLDEEEAAAASMSPLVPFVDTIRLLQESRRDGIRADPRASAETLSDLTRELKALESRLRSADRASGPNDIGAMLANRAAEWVDSLAVVLDSWYGFAAGYDPLFTWWAASPCESARDALVAYAAALREVLGQTPDADIVVGQPIGESGLRAHLRHEMISYTADELIAIAEREF